MKENHFLDNFRDLTNAQKITSILVILAAVIFLGVAVFSGMFNKQDTPKDETGNGTVIEQPIEEPTESATPKDTDPVAETNSLPRVTGSNVELPRITGGNKLQVVDARKALDVAEKGVMEVINWKVNEKTVDRQKRIDKYFLKESVSKLSTPQLNGTSEESTNKETGNGHWASHGTIGTLSVVGGDANRFRVNVGLNLRLQAMDGKSPKALTAVSAGEYVYTVDLKKVNNNWKIIEMAKEK